jgi:hypothetical protein
VWIPKLQSVNIIASSDSSHEPQYETDKTIIEMVDDIINAVLHYCRNAFGDVNGGSLPLFPPQYELFDDEQSRLSCLVQCLRETSDQLNQSDWLGCEEKILLPEKCLCTLF